MLPFLLEGDDLCEGTMCDDLAARYAFIGG